MTFSISWDWLSPSHEAPEVARTSARLKIEFGQEVLTRNVDEWAKTESDDVPLSAYPLALWLASNWWRLRWEPPPSKKPNLSWKMAHQLAAAGYGYIWPTVLMASDGEDVQIWARPFSERTVAPVQYLTGADGIISGEDFERTVDQFLTGVLARLNAFGIDHSELHELYQELNEERGNAELSLYRRLEAIAGFNAGEGPDGILARLEALMPKAGIGAVQEIAALCISSPSEQILIDAERLADTPGLSAEPDKRVMKAEIWSPNKKMPVWERGWKMAQELRSHLRFNGNPVSDGDLLNLMGISSTPDEVFGLKREKYALGLAVRRDERRLNLHLGRRYHEARRFELARFLCDYMTTGTKECWLPVTDGETSRQKIQRAFSAEFLCPINALQNFLGDDVSEDAIREAAIHFKVGELAVETQLVNHGFRPRDRLPNFEER